MGNRILAIIMVAAMIGALAGCRKNTVEEPTEMTEHATQTATVATEETIPEETKTEDLSFFDGVELEEETVDPEETVSGTEATEPTEGATEEATESEKETESETATEAKPDDSNSGSDSGYVEDGDMLEPPLNDSSVELG